MLYDYFSGIGEAMAEVSVIIVNWNTKELLKQAVASVLNLKTQIKSEIIVVDNGSTDGSLEFIRKAFPEIKAISCERNYGFAKAVNLGVHQSHGSYIFLLNSDAQLLPGTLEKLKSVMELNPKAGVAGGELIFQNGKKQNSIGLIPDFFTEVLNKSLLQVLFPKRYPSKRLRYDKATEVPSVIGAGILINRKALEAVGLLDERYFFFLEETDLCCQIQKKGWKCLFVPGAQLIHMQGQTAKKYPNRAKIEFYRSRYLFFRKNYGSPAVFFLAIGLLVKISLNWGLALLATILSAGLWKDMRQRFVRYSALWVWHVLGCPKKMGLSVL